MHRQLFRINSPNQKYVENVCNDKSFPFHFACRQCYLYISPPN